MDWIDVIGYAGTGLTVLSYSMRRMLPLRIAAVSSSVAFLTYASFTGAGPLIVMEMILLPINGYRLLELISVPRESGGLDSS